MADPNMRPTPKTSVSTAKAPAKPEPAAKPGEIMVTYIPRDIGDPVETTWNDHRFVANVPRPVSHEGMIAQAKNNPWFKVDGHDPAEGVKADGPPTDSEGYRRHAIAWFKTVTSAAEMKERWEAEDDLRKACGVGTDDLEYLDKLYTPRLAELTRAES